METVESRREQAQAALVDQMDEIHDQLRDMQYEMTALEDLLEDLRRAWEAL